MHRILAIIGIICLWSCRPNDPTTGNEVGQTAENSSTASPTLPPAAPNPFPGDWVSVQDNKERVVLTTDRFTSYYDNLKMADKPLYYYDRCPGQCAGQSAPTNQPCFRLQNGSTSTCYSVLIVNDTLLEISMLGGKGNTLRYRRRK